MVQRGHQQLLIGVVFVLLWIVAPHPAAADWLFTGFVGPITNVNTQPSTTPSFPAEQFDTSTGFGVNFATAFPAKRNLGFEFDWGVYKKGLERSDRFGTRYASDLMSLSPNFFYSFSTPHVRPYIAVGPAFEYRDDRIGETVNRTPGAWAVGMNIGGGVILFANEHIGGRVDLRYFKNFSDFVDLSNASAGGQAWNGLSFFRVFFGVTVH